MRRIRLQDDITLVRAGQVVAGSGRTPPAPVIDIPGEDAFSLILQLQDFPHHKLWRGQRLVHAGAHLGGDMALTDLREQWRCQHLSSYDNVRLQLPRATIEQLSEESGRRISGFGQVQAARDPVVWHLMQSMLPAVSEAASGTPTETPTQSDTVFLDTVVLALHTHLAQRYGAQPPVSGGARLAGWQQVRAREYMLAHLARRLTLAEIAAHCGLSRAHFARAFKLSFGLPPHAWLQQQRIVLACRLLRQSDKGMTAIALECGFSDQSHFSRVFRQVKGMSPMAWLRAQR